MSSPRIKAVLLAAGLGTRLRPLTEKVPKCLVTIEGRPLLDYWFRQLERAGVYRVLINTHHHTEQVRDYLAHLRSRGKWEIVEAYESRLLGSAGTIHENRGWMDDADECLIIYADNLSSIELRNVIDFHRSHDDPLTMVLFRTSRPKECGIAEIDENNRIISFKEKPDQPASDLANAGIYMTTAEAYREIADRNGFDIGFDIIPLFVGRMKGYRFEGYHRDIGNLDALEQARQKARELFGTNE